MKPYWIKVRDSGCFQMKVMADEVHDNNYEYNFLIDKHIFFRLQTKDVVYIIFPVKVDGEWVKPDNITYIQQEEE